MNMRVSQSAAFKFLQDRIASEAYLRRLCSDIEGLPARHRRIKSGETVKERDRRHKQLGAKYRQLARMTDGDPEATDYSILRIDNGRKVSEDWLLELGLHRFKNRPTYAELLIALAEDIEKTPPLPGQWPRVQSLQRYVIRVITTLLLDTGAYKRRPIAAITELAGIVLRKDIAKETVRKTLQRI